MDAQRIIDGWEVTEWVSVVYGNYAMAFRGDTSIEYNGSNLEIEYYADYDGQGRIDIPITVVRELLEIHERRSGNA